MSWKRILFFTALIALCAVLSAGCAAGLVMEMETVWNVEDTHVRTETPPETVLTRNGSMLGYDADSDTYYCTLGMENGDAWPELFIMASNGVQLGITDDYTYDSCSEAIRNGNLYELLLWNESGYHYSRIVFTGLPMIVMTAQDGAEYETDVNVPTEFSLASGGTDGLISDSLVHLRGGGYSHRLKRNSYHVELHSGNEKSSVSLLGMKSDTDWLLLSNAADKTLMANGIAWKLWNEWNEGSGIAMLQSRQVELFVNCEYLGIYQLSERIRPKKELKALGWRKKDSFVYRMITLRNNSQRTRWTLGRVRDRAAELRYRSDSSTDSDALAALLPFYACFEAGPEQMDDETFTREILQHFDITNLVSLYLFTQVTDNYDSVVNRNNLYIWANRQEDGTCRYLLSPWDMDSSFLNTDKRGRPVPNGLLPGADMIERVLDLNIGGSREILWKIWKEKCQGELCQEKLPEWMKTAETELNDSGAAHRTALLLGIGTEDENTLSSEQLRLFTVGHLVMVEDALGERWPLQDAVK